MKFIELGDNFVNLEQVTFVSIEEREIKRAGKLLLRYILCLHLPCGGRVTEKYETPEEAKAALQQFRAILLSSNDQERF